MAMLPGDWNCPSCGDHQFGRNTSCRKCGTPKPGGGSSAMAAFAALAAGAASGGKGGKGSIPPGDWLCPACGDHQFARNDSCRQCGTPKPAHVGPNPGPSAAGKGMMGAMGGGSSGVGGVSNNVMQALALLSAASSLANSGSFDMSAMFGGKGGGKGMMPGDWLCTKCGDHQFARNATCKMCGNPKPGDGQGGVLTKPSYAKMMPGDWICPSCNDHQFARNQACKQCGGPKPAGAGLAGKGGPY
eukprot:TRINITY_DN41512_c0_g1_i1.p1 TRINITY_DN41512_c0_g1~~TRINITY_DN41512_c0_g1_i1.p1  ORF type:complete len:261 (-),score=35.09 TRINITY_DN41512_c0_g1_i1:53-784(-)